MRITVHIPDRLEADVKRCAANEGKSVSSLTAEALGYYLQALRRRKAGERVLALAGSAPPATDALEALDRLREDGHDRP
ncbi:MAG: hypothetical protein KA419_17635 [Acidobacteria bacterium]|nr:hypothetical protein [Acidobacteriota bacterium]